MQDQSDCGQFLPMSDVLVFPLFGFWDEGKKVN